MRSLDALRSLESGVWRHSGVSSLESGVTPESGGWSRSGVWMLESGVTPDHPNNYIHMGY